MNPVGQLAQPTTPVSSENVPAGQLSHSLSLSREQSTVWYVPALHVAQLLAFPNVQNVVNAWHDASFVFSAAEAGVE